MTNTLLETNETEPVIQHSKVQTGSFTINDDVRMSLCVQLCYQTNWLTSSFTSKIEEHWTTCSFFHMLDHIETTSFQGVVHEISSLPRRLSSPMVVGLHGGGVMLSSRHQFDRTKPSSLFPDEDHSYEPRRQVRFATLSRNALPYSESVRPQRRRPQHSPPKRKKVPPPTLHKQDSLQVPISPTVQALRKTHGRQKKVDEQFAENQQTGHPARVVFEDDPVSNELWGFPVKYSPQKQLEAQWRATDEQNQRLVFTKQEKATQLQHTAIRSQQEVKKNEDDYALYLYLASLYGPLDALLYCCCQPGSHGRVYMLLVDVCARRMQRWTFQRVAALRRYWVGFLARAITTTSIAEGFEAIVHSFQQDGQASALFQRLKLLRAARALRTWSDYSSRMIQLRGKMRSALAKGLESRFYQWRGNVETRKRFKLQLKRVARRKAMQYAFEQWQIWRSQHEKLRCHLVQKWLQTKRECWKIWCTFVRFNGSAKILQRSWRLYSWRRQRYASVRMTQRVYRGWRRRRNVKQVRFKMDIHSVLLRVTNVTTWKLRCEMLAKQRRLILEREIGRARQQANYVIHAEEQVKLLVESELSKVVRNSMHRKLDDHIRFLKENDLSVPVQLAKTSSYLRRAATQKILDDERELARREAIEAFRATYDQQSERNGNPCFICQAHADFRIHESLDDFGFSNPHKCLSDCGVSTVLAGDALVELYKWKKAAEGELEMLERYEHEYTKILLMSDPPIASLWKSIADNQNVVAAIC